MISKINSITNNSNNLYKMNYSSTLRGTQTPHFGNVGKAAAVDKFFKTHKQKVYTLDEAFAKASELMSTQKENNLPLRSDIDKCGNLLNLNLNVINPRKDGNYIIKISFNTTNATSRGSIGIAKGTAEEINSKIRSSNFSESIQNRLDQISLHYNDEPEIIDLKG